MLFEAFAPLSGVFPLPSGPSGLVGRLLCYVRLLVLHSVKSQLGFKRRKAGGVPVSRPEPASHSRRAEWLAVPREMPLDSGRLGSFVWIGSAPVSALSRLLKCTSFAPSSPFRGRAVTAWLGPAVGVGVRL